MTEGAFTADPIFVLAVLGMTAVTYALRAGGYWVMGRLPITPRLRRGLGGQAFSQIVSFSIQIGSVPLFLHFWGTGLYGEWLVLAAFPAYLVISDLGFTTATSNEVTMSAFSYSPKA